MFKGAGNCAVLRHIQFDRWQSTSTCSRHLMMLYEHYNHLQISCNFLQFLSIGNLNELSSRVFIPPATLLPEKVYSNGE
jgi:hypothetical protein